MLPELGCFIALKTCIRQDFPRQRRCSRDTIKETSL